MLANVPPFDDLFVDYCRIGQNLLELGVAGDVQPPDDRPMEETSEDFKKRRGREMDAKTILVDKGSFVDRVTLAETLLQSLGSIRPGYCSSQIGLSYQTKTQIMRERENCYSGIMIREFSWCAEWGCGMRVPG